MRRLACLAVSFGALLVIFGSPVWPALFLLGALVEYGACALAFRFGWPRALTAGIFALVSVPWLVAKLTFPAFPFVGAGYPMGITFLFLGAVSFLLDSRRGVIRERPPVLDYLLFRFWFPKFYAGPVERFPDFQRNLRDPGPPFRERVVPALFLFTHGSFKRWVVALIASRITATFFETGTAGSALAAILFAHLYLLELYANFSGYSDYSRGISLLFGIDLVRNFSQPLFATNPQAYWQRWHRGFSLWLRDYLFEPVFLATKTVPLAILAAFLGMGLWMGGAFEARFLVLGLGWGLVLVAYYFLKPALARVRPVAGAPLAVWGVLSWALFLETAVALTVPHHIQDLPALREALRSLAGPVFVGGEGTAAAALLILALPVFAIDFLLLRRGGDEARLTPAELAICGALMLGFTAWLLRAYGTPSASELSAYFYRRF